MYCEYLMRYSKTLVPDMFKRATIIKFIPVSGAIRPIKLYSRGKSKVMVDVKHRIIDV